MIDLLGTAVVSLLIKGNPGVGKTTLALGLMKGFRNSAYLSTRVSENKLTQQHPSLRKAGRGKGALRRTTPSGEGRIEDLRLGSASEFMKQALSFIEKKRPSLLVLDSWDALAKELDLGERLKAERVLVAAADANEAKIVFVSEEPTQTTTDYLADAVVTLYNTSLNGKRLREIEINKVRGTEVPSNRYLFTLKGGQFEYLRPDIAETPAKPGKFKPLPHGGVRLSTGSKDLDGLLEGGLRVGSFNLLELGENLPSEWILPFMVNIRCNFLHNGGGVFSIPTGGITPEMVRSSLEPYVDGETLKARLRVATFGRGIQGPCYFALKPNQTIQDIFLDSWARILEVGEGGKRPVFMTVGMDVIENLFGSEGTMGVSVVAIDSVRGSGGTVFHITKASTKVTQRLADICDLHLKMESIHNSLVLQGIKPYTLLHSVSYDYSEGFPKVKLTPIM